MERFILISVILALLAPCTVNAEETLGNLTVIVPPDKAITESSVISIVLRVAGNAVDQLQISVNDGKRLLIAKPASQRFACKDGIKLSSGLNRVKVVGLKDGKKVEEVHTQVFSRPDLTQISSDVPPGFKQYPFHVDSREKPCVPCHQLEFSSKTAGKIPSGDPSPCFRCHKKILSNAFLHGPAAGWYCLTCHDAKSKNPKLAVLKPDEKICANCHEFSWKDMKYQHGPAAAGSCTTCHNPHAANNANFLRLSAGDLCATCHEEILSGRHLLASFSNDGHPVRLYADPFHPGREFNCVSCHNPHGGNSPRFLNGYDDSMGMMAFCMGCHKM